RQQHERRWKLTEIERRQRTADQVRRTGAREMAGQERIAAEINAVDAAEQKADLPDQLVAPVRPPTPAGGEGLRTGVLGPRRERGRQERDQEQGRAPDRQAPA